MDAFVRWFVIGALTMNLIGILFLCLVVLVAAFSNGGETMKLSRTETNTIAGVVTDLLFIAGAMNMHDAARKRIIDHAETLTALVGGAELERDTPMSAVDAVDAARA